MNKYEKQVGNAIIMFQTFRKVNLVTLLSNMSSKNLLNEWIYISIPIVLYLGNIANMIKSGVLYHFEEPKKFAYFNDFSNSMALTTLFFISYFLSGYYPKKFDEFIYYGARKMYIKEISRKFKNRKKSYIGLFSIGIILFTIGFLSGYSFYSVAKSNASAYWIYNLSDFGRIYYCIFLGITWYQSLSLLGMALSAGFMVYWCIKDEGLIYIEEDYNKNISIIKATDILICTFSYGLFYIIGAVLFILNDKVAGSEYKVYNAFYNDYASFVLILIVLLLVMLAFVPLKQLFKFMRLKKDRLIVKINDDISVEESVVKKRKMIEERNSLISQDLILTSLTNKIIVVMSVVIPLIGVVFQGIDLFQKK